MVVRVLLFLCVTETLQHLSYPINYCNMASTCVHDGHSVCASSPDGCSRKSFLDQCDMYEYNCDYSTRYQETYILFCGTFMTPTQLTHIQSIITENPTNIGPNKSSSKFTKMLPENITSKSQISDTDNKINPTVPLTVVPSTSVTPIVTKDSKENITKGNDNPTTPVNCCDRPVTWETTTEVTNIFEPIEYNNPDENNHIIKSDSNENNQVTEVDGERNFTEFNITHVNIQTTLSTINNELSKTVLLKGDTELETTATYEKTESYIEVVKQTSPEYCCNRPSSWETTTEVLSISHVTVESNYPQENYIDKIIYDKDENTVVPDDGPTESIAHTNTDSSTKDTSRYPTSYTPNVKLHLTTKLPIFSKLFNNCGNKCQRPATWLTTVMRKRYHF